MKQLTGADFLSSPMGFVLRQGVNLGGWLLLEPGPSAPLSYWSELWGGFLKIPGVGWVIDETSEN